MRHNKLFSCFFVFLFSLVCFPDGALAENQRFLVLPFHNATDTKAMEFLRTALPAEISRRLENYEKLYPAKPDTVFPKNFDFGYPLGDRDIEALVKAHGATYIFAGKFHGPNWKAKITIDLIEYSDNRLKIVSASRDIVLDGKEIREFAFLSEVLFELLDKFGLAPDATSWAKISVPPIRDHYAYVFLGRALAAYRGVNREVNLDTAEEFLRVATRTEPGYAYAHRLLGLVLLANGEERRGVNQLEEAAGLNKSDAVSRIVLAKMAVDSGDFGKALELANEAAAVRPSDASLQLLIGETAYALQRVDVAEQALQKATALEPAMLPARHLLAKIYAAKGDGKKLITELEVIVKLAPADTATRFALAAAYHRFGDDSRAVETYKAIVAKNPRKVLAYKALGDLHRQMGDRDNAAAMYKLGHRLAPNDPRFEFLLSEVAFEEKNYTEAEKYFRRSLRHQKFAKFAENNLAVTRAAYGDTADARAILQNLLTRAPEYFVGRYNLAALLILSGEVRPAIEILEELRQIEPQMMEPHFALGVAYTALGVKTRAKAAFEAAAVLSPDDAAVKENLAALQTANLPRKDIQLLTDSPFQGSDGIANLILRGQLAARDVSADRAAFYASADNIQKALEAAPQPRKGKRVCPVSAIAGSYKPIYGAYNGFIFRGKALEDIVGRMKLAEISGELELATSEAKSEFDRAYSEYRRALADLREMRLVLQEELPAELTACNCSETLLTAGATTEVQGESRGKPPQSAPATQPAPPAGFVEIGVIFTLDNRSCGEPFDVYVDKTLLGRVAPGERMSFRVAKGYHFLCIIPASGQMKCGEAGTLRHGYFESNLTFVAKCR